MDVNLLDPNMGALDAIVNVFWKLCQTSFGTLREPALYICAVLLMIEFATDWSMYDGNVRISKFINDIVKGAFFIFIVWHWNTLINWTEKFFVQVGFLAGGGSDSDAATPSQIINTGFKRCEKLYEGLSANWDKAAKDAAKKGYEQLSQNTETTDVDANSRNDMINAAINAFHPLGMLCYLIAIIMIIFAHLWIALQLLLCQVEFYIFSGIATIFLPFGVCKHTKFLFDRVIQGMVNFGVKLLGVFFLISVIGNSMNFLAKETVIPANQAFSYYCRIGLIYLCLAFLVWKLPDKFASLMSGSGPSISGGEAFAAGAMVGGKAVGMAKGVAGAGLSTVAMATHASANQRQYDAYQKQYAGYGAQIANLDSAISQTSDPGMRALLQQQRLDVESKRDNVKDKMGAVGSRSFLGVLGTKIGARVTQPWTDRRTNLGRDDSQWGSVKSGDFSDTKSDAYFKK